LLKPPELKPMADSDCGAGKPEAGSVPPTLVTYGEEAGMFGVNLPPLQLAPESPLAKSRVMPRAPTFMNSAFKRVAAAFDQVL